MRPLRFLLLALAAAALAGCAAEPPPNAVASVSLPQPPAGPAPEYVMQPGDVIDIKLYSHPELNESVALRPDGRISLQLVDEVMAAGLTPAALDELLTERYARRLKNPDVAVIVREANTQKIYVGGEVRTPGLLPLQGRVTSLQAIMQSGGFMPTAEPRTVFVLRDTGAPQPQFIVANLEADLTQPGTRNDVVLQPKDVVFVPRSQIAQANLFVEQYIDKLIPIQRSIGVFYDLGGTR